MKNIDSFILFSVFYWQPRIEILWCATMSPRSNSRPLPAAPLLLRPCLASGIVDRTLGAAPMQTSPNHLACIGADLICLLAQTCPHGGSTRWPHPTSPDGYVRPRLCGSRSWPRRVETTPGAYARPCLALVTVAGDLTVVARLTMGCSPVCNILWTRVAVEVVTMVSS